MRLARAARIKGEGGLALLVIVLLILAGIAWWLYSSRQTAERNARAFAADVARRLAVNYDEKFLHVNLSPDGQRTYLKSARDRLVERLRALGVPAQPIEVEGDVTFTNGFFEPRGRFQAKLKYPATSGKLDLDIASGLSVWQIEAVNLTWDQPAPTPTPAAAMVMASPTPTPTPTPAPRQKQRRKRNR
jgi:hypothetical protein